MGTVHEPRRSATIYAVAERAGVSTATVSRVLAGSDKVAPKTRDGVLAAIRELDYLPDASARALAARTNGALGLVLPHIDGPYYAELLVGFEMAASRLGRSVVISLANPAEDARMSVRRLAARVDGIAFMARSAADDPLISEIAARKPVVTAARAQIPGRDAFFVENRATARALTEQLLEDGHRRIGFVGATEPGSDLEARFRGYLDALAEEGIAPISFEAEPTEAGGVAVAAKIHRRLAELDALMCGNDESALAVMRFLQNKGVRVPNDIAVTGWDDIHAARYAQPPLTTVAQPVRALGETAAARLVELIDGAEPDGQAAYLPSTIVFRESSGSCTIPQSTKELS